MDDRPMTPIGDALERSLASLGSDDHIPADPGDYIGSDGYLHCGTCKRRKEYRLNLPGRETPIVVPTMCQCRIDERDREEREQQLRRERLVVDELFSYSLTDERFKEATFDRFKETPDNVKALRVARNYVEHFDELYAANTGLLMYGPPGTGKTFAAACIANALMERGIPVLVTSIVKLTSGYSDELQTILRKMKSARLLVLDDFGAERNTDFKAEQIFDVIDTRYNSKRPMIITTNLTLDNIKNDPDMRRRRVNDRILEVCHPVRMVWDSWRKTNVMQKYNATISILEGGGNAAD